MMRTTRGGTIPVTDRKRTKTAKKVTDIYEWCISTRAAYSLDTWRGISNEGSFLYFIQSDSGGRVKIGRAIDPGARLRQLQTASSDMLIVRELLYIGNTYAERAWHRHWVRDRHRGEWFGNEAAVLAIAGHLAEVQLDAYERGETLEHCVRIAAEPCEILDHSDVAA